MSITYFEVVFVAVGISMFCACAVLFCHLWPVSLYSIFPRYFIKGTIFGKIIEHEMWFCSVYNVCVKYFLFYEELSDVSYM
jgi:hypothetical protein